MGKGQIKQKNDLQKKKNKNRFSESFWFGLALQGAVYTRHQKRTTNFSQYGYKNV